MCSLVVARGLRGGPGLFVIHNRDEQLSRPSAPPMRWERGEREILAPRDLKAGGTWLGLNDRGVVAAITNRYRSRPASEHRSRGELPVMALEAESAREGAERVAKVGAGEYGGFHLVVADEAETFVVWNDQEEVRLQEVEQAVLVMTERGLGAARSRRYEMLVGAMEGVEEWPEEGEEFFRGWMQITDEEDPLEGTCICSGPVYGTKCSAVIVVDEGAARFEYADGPPCRVGYSVVVG